MHTLQDYAEFPAVKRGRGRPPKPTTAARRFLESLTVPEGPKAGEPVALAPYQSAFVRGALAAGTKIAVLSIGRGNGKSALGAGLALGALLGALGDRQPRREVIIAARTRDQAAITFTFALGFLRGLDVAGAVKVRRSPRLELEYEGDGGGHILRAIAADGKTALGLAPTFVVLDERGHWPTEKGDDLEAALLSGLGKRSGRALMISTSAEDDTHPFSVWCDAEDEPGIYVQEHRPEPGLPADDLDSLAEANPGAAHGIGSTLEWLQAEARRAISRGGSTLQAFRLYNRNERVAGTARDALITADEWKRCEVAELPERSGPCVVGIDLGGSAAMTAAAFYWPTTGRMEARAWLPSVPNLAARGASDGVSGRYLDMARRGELSTLGDRTVPVAEWLGEVLALVEGEPVAAFVADRYKQAELAEAFERAGVRSPVVWRGTGWRDGNEDCDRFRRAAFDGRLRSAPSLLMRSALADAVCLRDPAANLKLAKGRSTGRIDAVQAAVIAVAEGVRLTARPTPRPARWLWA